MSPTPPNQLNPCQALVLGVLQSGSRSAADVVRIAESMEFWTFSRSQVYREANSLFALGAINSAPISGRASLMTVTPLGRELYAKWSAEFLARTEIQIRDPYYLRVRLAEHDGSNLQNVISRAVTTQRDAARIHRTKGLPGPTPPDSQLWAAYHDAMSVLVSHLLVDSSDGS